MPDFQPSLFGRVTDLKQKKPSLKVLIALGVSLVILTCVIRLTFPGLDAQRSWQVSEGVL